MHQPIQMQHLTTYSTPFFYRSASFVESLLVAHVQIQIHLLRYSCRLISYIDRQYCLHALPIAVANSSHVLSLVKISRNNTLIKDIYSDSISPVISHDFFYKSSFASIFSRKRRGSHQGKKEVACIVSKPLVSCLWGRGESVNPPKFNIHVVQGALSSRPKGDPDLLPIFQDCLLLSNHTPLYMYVCAMYMYMSKYMHSFCYFWFQSWHPVCV